MRKLVDQDLLAKIAQSDPDQRVALEAVSCLNDQSLLTEIANSGGADSVRATAIAKLTDQSHLANLARGNYSDGVRIAAVRQLKNQDVLVEIAIGKGGRGILMAAVETLTSDALLAGVAAKAGNSEVASAALERISGPIKRALQRLPPGNASSLAIELELALRLNDLGKFERALNQLPSVKGPNHNTHLTPFIDKMLAEARAGGQAPFIDHLEKFKTKHLDVFDLIPLTMTRIQLQGNFWAMMSMPGMPRSRTNYHLVTVWFEDGTSIRHAKVFDRNQLEVPIGWQDKILQQMAFLLEQP